MKQTFLRVSPYFLQSWIRMLSFKQFLRTPWTLKRKKGHVSSEAMAHMCLPSPSSCASPSRCCSLYRVRRSHCARDTRRVWGASRGPFASWRLRPQVCPIPLWVSPPPRTPSHHVLYNKTGPSLPVSRQVFILPPSPFLPLIFLEDNGNIQQVRKNKAAD